MFFSLTNGKGITYMSSLRKCVDAVLDNSPSEIIINESRNINLAEMNRNTMSRAIKKAFVGNKNKVTVNTNKGIYAIKGID